MVDSIGRMSLGRTSTQGRKRKEIIRRVRTRAEQNRDISRMKLLEARRRYKIKVKRNEEKMDARKEGREENKNPTAYCTTPSRDYAKSLRNPANWSAIPSKPKYSNALSHRERIYGKRFKLVEAERLVTEPEEKEEAKVVKKVPAKRIKKPKSKKTKLKKGVKK